MSALAADPMLAVDLLLALVIVGVAATTLLVRDAFAMIVAFVAFGMLVALAWARLLAPDVALAEAAVGTGITGALLLRTLAHLRGGSLSAVRAEPAADRPDAVSLGLNAALAALATGLLGLAFLGLPAIGPGLGPQVQGEMAQSGVTHAVTAVLLNFRAWDTLMEVVVLMAAVIVVWQVERGLSDAPAPAMGEVYRGFARIALPVSVVAGAYLLWIGASAPGGAFQGGAVLAAVLLLVLLSRLYRPAPGHRAVLRGAFVLGVAVFAGVALAVTGAGRATLEYPVAQAKSLILLIEAMVTISIAVTLAALFHGREPAMIAPERDR